MHYQNLQDAKIERFVSEYGLLVKMQQLLTVARKTADFLDATVKAGADPKTVAKLDALVTCPR